MRPFREQNSVRQSLEEYNFFLLPIIFSIYSITFILFCNNCFCSGNPLQCGCDIEWILVDPVILSKFASAQCADGTFLTDLDPAYYEHLC